MNQDPARLLDLEDVGASHALLRAARSDAPADRLLGETLLALGVGAGAVGVGAAVSGGLAGGSATLLKASTSSSLGVMALKWLGIGALGGAVTMGAASGIVELRKPNRVEPHAQAVAPREPPVEAPKPAAPRPEVVAVAPPKDDAPPRVKSAASEEKPKEPSMAEELDSLDRARKALSSGNAAGALAILDAYDRSPRPHRLEQEALLLRMDALERSGNLVRAREIAKALLDRSPSGPHAARARKLLGQIDPQ